MLRLRFTCLCALTFFICGCATGTAAPPTPVVGKDSGVGGGADAEQEQPPGDTGPLPEGSAGAPPDGSPETSFDGDAPQDVDVPDIPVCDAHVVINEIQTEGNTEPEDEFIELFNGGTCAVQMDEYSLYYRSGSGTTDSTLWTAVAGQKLNPGQYFVLGGAKYSFGAPDFPISPGVSLGASGGGLGLKKGTKTIDMVGWGNANNAYVDNTAASAPAAGKSIGRTPNGTDTDNNLVDFKQGTPSPRKANQ